MAEGAGGTFDSCFDTPRVLDGRRVFGGAEGGCTARSTGLRLLPACLGAVVPTILQYAVLFFLVALAALGRGEGNSVSDMCGGCVFPGSLMVVS